jgi:L-alanine-DL-glutamate epimerase-like enolase superfamily enzyme
MTLETEFGWLELSIDTPFTTSRGTMATAENAIVRVTDDAGRVGIGGATPTPYFGDTRESMAETLPELFDVVESIGDPHQQQRLARRVRETTGGPRAQPAARLAVSIAVHDLACKQLAVPISRYWGLDPAETVPTSYTVGLADTDEMADRAAAIVDAGYDILKVKLGTDRDREIVAAIREAAPAATIRVDANEAWGPETAIETTKWLTDRGVEFVEQPVPADDPEGMRRVREEGALPVAADESCVIPQDVPTVAEVADIAVVKLAKCGGLRPAIETIHAARAHGLEVMLGCMVESNASIAPAAHLTPLVEYADLDGSLLLADDPLAGVPMPDGRVDLAALDRPGTGVRLRDGGE